MSAPVVTQFDRRASIIPLDTRRKLIRREPLKHDTLGRDAARQRGNHERFLFDLGLTVTIGIAVKPIVGDFIVTVSDLRQSFNNEVQPVESGALKAAQIAGTWGFLFAGGQMGYARTIAQRARNALGYSHVAMDGDIAEQKTFDEVKIAVMDAYNSVSDELVLHNYPRRYSFSSVADFRAKGYYQLGPKVTERISNKIDAFKLGIELLVFGFDESGGAKFLEINDTDVADQTVMDAWAIGTGTYLALASLNLRERTDQSIQSLIYKACEAKIRCRRRRRRR